MKYPRTYHLPFSPGASDSEKIITDMSQLLSTPVVVTEKLDGSNVCLMRKECFARSHASPPKHDSFDMFKAFHAQIKNLLPIHTQFFGEWLYAKHSIEYTNLPGYFLLFGVRELINKTWCSWKSVEKLAELLGVYTVPVIAANKIFDTVEDIKAFIDRHFTLPSMYAPQREGFVIRQQDSFDDDFFSQCVVKWVRAEHNQIDKHWMKKEIVRNKLQ